MRIYTINKEAKFQQQKANNVLLLLLLLLYSFSITNLCAVTDSKDTTKAVPTDSTKFHRLMQFDSTMLHTENRDHPIKDVSFGAVLFRLMLGLLLLVALLYFGLYGFKKFAMQGKLFNKSGINGETLQIFSLNPKHSVYIVSILDCIYVLGVSPERIELLEKIEDPEKVESIKARIPEKQLNFKKIFEKKQQT